MNCVKIAYFKSGNYEENSDKFEFPEFWCFPFIDKVPQNPKFLKYEIN